MASAGETTEDFAAKIGGMMVDGFSLFSICMGHDVGLFDVLAAQREPRTSQEIADAGNLKERYVRELLGALVMAGIVDLDSTSSGVDRFSLPAHRRSVLTKNGANSDSMLGGGLLIGLGGGSYHQVRECFQKDGPRGVPYESYHPALTAVNKLNTKFLCEHLVPDVIGHYPELKAKLEKGISVLDVGCGYGVSTMALAKAFPGSTFCGIDFLEESIQGARERDDGSRNVSFEVQDATRLPSDWTNKFDLVFLHDAVHDQAHPDRMLKEATRVLIDRGLLLALEPKSHTKMRDNLEKLEGMQVLYTISLLHCMPVSLYFEGGMGLGACWGREKAVEMMQAAGLRVISTGNNPGGRGQHFFCEKRTH